MPMGRPRIYAVPADRASSRPEALRRASQKYKAKQRAIINAMKAKPCADCGQTFRIECMDFDHRDRRDKRFTIGDCSWRKTIDLIAEAANCDVVCANCHRIRTHRRI